MKVNDYKAILYIVVSALLTVLGADFALQTLSPVTRLREVQEGIADLENSNPDSLVLSSSHGRTFDKLAQELTILTNHSSTMVAIPVESGKMSAYEWLLFNRIAPLVDEQTARGAQLRDRIKRMFNVTLWWDTCASREPLWNLPSRVWTLEHYAKHVSSHGLNDYNRNYVKTRLRRLFAWSTLVQERTNPKIREGLAVIRLFKADRDSILLRSREERLAKWRSEAEQGIECIWSASEVQALDRMLLFARDRSIEPIIVLFPLMPLTITEQAKATTLSAFRLLIAEKAQAFNARLYDFTLSGPFTDSDFMDDFDHLTNEGNLKFAEWALQNELSFLLQPPANRPPGS
jgi:hypothetical protein